MTGHTQQVRINDNDATTETTHTETDDNYAASTTPRLTSASLAARVIWFIAGVVITLLALRFIFVLFGANPNNGFVNFIYTVSHPFAAPFFGIFNYTQHYGTARFEGSTLIAIAVYALIAWGLARLVTIRQPRQ
jgi:hypothetical protein